MSRYSRYPFQNAAPPHQQHQQLRNPWAAPLECRESQSTNSSSSSRTQPVAIFNHHKPRSAASQHHYAVVEPPLALDVLNAHSGQLLLPGPQGVPVVQPVGSERERPVTPASTPGSGGGAVDGCGGHCVAFENFCYYCLQVVFMVGILSGASLSLAGAVRGGRLLVLVYIGLLAAAVCSVLLAVQCCVRRTVKRRKRLLRERAAARRPQAQPLLLQLVQHHDAHRVRTSNPPVEVHLDTSRSGTPWWRRRADMQHIVTRH